MAYCNMAGGPYCGKSVVVAPNGTVLGKLGSEDGVATVVIDPLNAEYTRHRLRNPLWRDRRPELYGSLAQLK
jgi:predicted amidohydrolase